MNNLKLDMIQILIDPNKDKIKDILRLLENFYIEEYGECYQEKIVDNFSRCNFIFLKTLEESQRFAEFIPKFLLNQCYLELMNQLTDFNNPAFFKMKQVIQEKARKIQTNEITEQINLHQEIQQIKGQIQQVMESSTEIDNIATWESIFAYLEDKINYFEQIDQDITRQKGYLSGLKKIEEKFRKTLQRKFLLEHSYLLRDSEMDDILKEKKNIDEIIDNSEQLKLYVSNFFSDIVFAPGQLSVFKKEYTESSIFKTYRQNVLKAFGIAFEEKELVNLEWCLDQLNFKIKGEDGNFYSGLKGLEILDSVIAKYNQEYSTFNKEIENYLMPKERFVSKNIMSVEWLQRKENRVLNLSLQQCNTKWNSTTFTKTVLKYIDNITPNVDGLRLAYSVYFEEKDLEFSYVLLKPWANMKYDIQNLHSPFLYTLAHEMGHVASPGFDIGNMHTLFNELFNEYLANKITTKILTNYSNEVQNYQDINTSLHHLNSFLIEPLVMEYDHILKEASMQNSIRPLLDLMGSDLLQQYEMIIKEFYTNQQKYASSKEIFEKEPEYVQLVKEQIHNICLEISQNKNRKK